MVDFMGVVEGFDHPGYPADTTLDRAGFEAGMALEHARGDQVHERVHNGRHRVRNIVNQRPAIAPDRARVASGRDVEGHGQVHFFDQRPEGLERFVVVLQLALFERTKDGFIRHGESLEAVLRSPSHFGHGSFKVAGGNHGHGHKARPVIAKGLQRPAVPGPEHRPLKNRVRRAKGQQTLVRKNNLGVNAIRVRVGQTLCDIGAGMVAAQIFGLKAL